MAVVLPDGQESIAGELDDVAAVVLDDVDEAAEVSVQQAGESSCALDSLRPGAR